MFANTQMMGMTKQPETAAPQVAPEHEAEFEQEGGNQAEQEKLAKEKGAGQTPVLDMAGRGPAPSPYPNQQQTNVPGKGAKVVRMP